jgi:hypothetical protein
MRIDSLALWILLLLFSGLALVSLSMALGWTPFRHETRLIVDVASEANVWTWANVVVLLTAGYTHLLAAYFRWRLGKPAVLSWIMTALILFALSLDDLAGIHERLEYWGRALGGGTGLTRFAWIIPGSAIALVIIGLFGLMIVRTDGRARRFLTVGLSSFFLGAIGMEAFGGHILTLEGNGYLYRLTYHFEEMLEAIGASLLLCAGLADLPAPARKSGFYLRPAPVDGGQPI